MVELEECQDTTYYQRLLGLNHAAFEQHLAKITALRVCLEDEEAKLAFCLFEEKRILAEMMRKA